MPFGQNDHWVEVAPNPDRRRVHRLAPSHGQCRHGRMTGIALKSTDPRPRPSDSPVRMSGHFQEDVKNLGMALITAVEESALGLPRFDGQG